MALNVGELVALLRLDKSNFSAGLDAAHAQAENATKALSSKMSSLGTKLTLGFTMPMLGVGAASVMAAGKMEQSQIAFETLLGNAQRAKTFLGELREFAEQTPFELPGLMQSSKRLLAFGFAANDIIPMMTKIGDAVSSLGGGEFEIQRVTNALGQMQAKGKVSAEEMMQLAEMGIPAWDMLAKSMNTSVAEVMSMASKGQITAAQGIQAILSGMDSRFKGAMEAQSKTLFGLWSTFKDKIAGMLVDVGEPLLTLGKTMIDLGTSALGVLSALTKGFAALPGPIQKLVIVFGGMVAALGPMLIGLAKIIEAWKSIKIVLAAARLQFIATWAAALGPLLPLIGLVTAFAVGAGLVIRHWKPIKAFFAGLWDAIYNLTIGKLMKIFNFIRDTIRRGIGYFQDLYNKVVGHSYIPDMVSGIQSQMQQLGGSAMVLPVQAAVSRTNQALAGTGNTAVGGAPAGGVGGSEVVRLLESLLAEARKSNRVSVLT